MTARHVRLMVAGLVLLGVALPAVAVAAPPYRTAKGKLSCSDGSVFPGQVITVSGSGFAGGAEVAVRFDVTLLTTTTADASGAISTDVAIPEDATKGRHVISASGATADGGTLVLKCAVRVSSQATAEVDVAQAEPVSASSGSGGWGGSSAVWPAVLALVVVLSLAAPVIGGRLARR